jgi:hypothetical protein
MITHDSAHAGSGRGLLASPARKLLVLAGALLALALAPALASAHHGHGRTAVAGTYTVYDLGSTQCAPKGKSPDILVCATTGLRSTYAGDLAGDSTSDFSEIIDCKAGTTRGSGIETFTGSLNGGASGTLTWRISFRAGFDCTTFFPSGFQGFSHIQASSGALAGIRGHLHFGDTTYDGVLRNG